MPDPEHESITNIFGFKTCHGCDLHKGEDFELRVRWKSNKRFTWVHSFQTSSLYLTTRIYYSTGIEDGIKLELDENTEKLLEKNHIIHAMKIELDEKAFQIKLLKASNFRKD